MWSRYQSCLCRIYPTADMARSPHLGCLVPKDNDFTHKKCSPVWCRDACNKAGLKTILLEDFWRLKWTTTSALLTLKEYRILSSYLRINISQKHCLFNFCTKEAVSKDGSFVLYSQPSVVC